MEFKQIEAFAAVVELKSFSKAATKLFLTQPTISAHIKSLEKELGARLILRNTKALTLSDSGEVLYGYAKDIISLRDEALNKFIHIPENLSGTITIAASTLPSQYILPSVLSSFRESYPKITFNIIKCDSGQVIKLLEDNRADIGITGTTVDCGNCIYEAFAEDTLIVVTPNSEEYKNITYFDKELLLKSPFITREDDSGTRKEYESYLNNVGINPASLNVVAKMDNIDSIRNCISNGLGISIMSYMGVSEYRDLGLVRCFPINNTTIVRNFYIVKVKNKSLTPITEKFVAKVREFKSYKGFCV